MKVNPLTVKIGWALFFWALFLVTGCSSLSMRQVWDHTKRASYTAVTDPVTWGTALGAAALYATNADEGLTDYFMDNNWVEDDVDVFMLDSNAAIALLTAVTIPGEEVHTKAKRVAVTFGAFGASRLAVVGLQEAIEKETPNGEKDYAIGSHHAVEPFAGSALTRRHVEAMALPAWAAYSIVGVSYTTASVAALTRVQEGDHSVADQLVNAAVGNFIGIFFNDAFMSQDNYVDVSLSKEHFYIGFNRVF
jgi:hypothetical protein